MSNFWHNMVTGGYPTGVEWVVIAGVLTLVGCAWISIRDFLDRRKK